MPQIPFSPSILLIGLLALGYASLFHLWRGHKWSDLIVWFLAALVGLTAGQLLGPWLNMTIGSIGETYVLLGTLLAWPLMLAASWLKG
jgi:hypothetical protein